MSRTVTAMFDSRQEAEDARQRLTSSNIDADRVRIIDKSSSSSSFASSSGSSGAAGGEGQGFWSSLKDMFVPDEDRHAYGEGISRGGYLLCAEVDEDQADEACRILEDSNSIDFEERERGWRNEGWTGYSAGAGTGGFAGAGATGFGTDADSGQSFSGTSGGLTGSTDQSFAGTTGSTGESFGKTDSTSTVAEEHIPIVEEQLRVGKREVNRGGARVRSYVREIPVHEQVNLREEHVSVERRPVSETFKAGELNRGDIFQERNIEMTETAEEAVVAKEAVVREELVVRKTAEEHVETVDDTVRRTEVDVDEGLAGSENRSAFGGFGSGTSGSGGLSNATSTGATGSGTARPSDLSDANTDGGNFQDRSRGF
jgi:uncharacterized protein (TIGR02271 family)